MVNGFNPACLYILPMLGRKDKEYPRFRDCFVEGDTIEIYTRVGGNNRGEGYGEEELYKDPNFLRTYDDSFDNTYGTYVFKVPDKWKQDFDYIVGGEFKKVSDEYYKVVCSFYPSLEANGVLAKLFERQAA